MKNLRPPVVTVLGHVDHGKTTLLDKLRSTSVVAREAGGITQGIGASIVTTKEGKKITFIDTPGHAAFSQMRSRGARLADIIILVVAADDGIMPQTSEAIGYIKGAKIPTIVAITKVDLPSANPESVIGQLEKEGVLLEGRGGDVPVIEVSAKKNLGVKELLELVNLVAEVNEIKGSPGSPLKAVVIETAKDRRGLLVSAVVKDGALKISDEIISGGTSAKVRGLFDDKGKSVRSVGPGEPCLILGFSTLPAVGSEIISKVGSQEVLKSSKKSQSRDVKPGELAVVVKAQNQGVLDAILEGIPAKVVVIEASVGDVTESDVFLAKAAGSEILVFAAKVGPSVKRLAETESVIIKKFEIIYELFDYLLTKFKESDAKVLAKAEIIKVFGGNKKERIAGCRLIIGRITKKDKLTLMRGIVKLGDIRVISLKKARTEMDEVKRGEEFGIYFEPQFDFKEGDMLLSRSK